MMSTENKYTKADLLQMQALPLSSKIRMSQLRIQEWYDHWDGQVYVSFSGGKDSTVLKHLVEQTVGDVPSLFINTGLEYPEIQRFAMSQPNVISVRPEKRFDEVIKEYGYPVVSKAVSNVLRLAKPVEGNTRYEKLQGISINKQTGELSAYNVKRYAYLMDAPFKVSEKCCDVMKKKPAHIYEKETGRKPYVGMLAEESRKREYGWFKTGCNAFSGQRIQSNPLAFWTEQDILTYLLTYKIPYSPIYGDIIQESTQLNLFNEEIPKLNTTGAKRTGCMFCMFGMSQDGCPNRFQRMKETHPKQYDYCMKPLEEGGLGLAKVLDYMGEKY